MKPDKKITGFIAKHHVLNLGTISKDGDPWGAACFYAYDKARNIFIFSTSEDTEHGKNIKDNPVVSATITLETRIVGKIQGLQIAGKITESSSEEKLVYFKRFPYALAAPVRLLTLTPNRMKLTDNTLGFGKKLLWTR